MASKYAPVITATGIAAPDFATNLANLKADYQSIFGADVYLGNDSQDGQLLAIIAQALTDCGAAAVAVYNSFSPATAQGNGLSSVVKINGLGRALPSSSTCDLTIVGVAGTIITNGQAQDTAGNVWALPASVTIPIGGSIIVTAICQTPGAITAAIGTITKVKTPVFGWQTVTNAGAAIAGAPVETDAQLRKRQSESVAIPSISIFEGVMAAIDPADIPGVTRRRGYENNTAAVDGNGIPAKSCSIFVEGGDVLAIQQVIAKKMTPGIPTNGNLTATIVDTSGSSKAVSFSRPTVATISVEVTVQALTGWSAGVIEPIIAQAVADYLNLLPIGQAVRYFDVSVPPRILGSPYSSAFALTGLRIKKNAGAFGAVDLAIAYNEVPVGATGNVSFVVT